MSFADALIRVKHEDPALYDRHVRFVDRQPSTKDGE
jgi:hypothetical protein